MEPPVSCPAPNCHSAYWRRPRRSTKHGRTFCGFPIVKSEASKKTQSKSKRQTRDQAKVQSRVRTPKVPVPIVGSAYEVDKSLFPINIVIDPSLPDGTIQAQDPEPQEIPGEVYGILGPPPSARNRAKELNNPEPKTYSGGSEIRDPVRYEKPVSAHVIDPEELTAEERARLERLISKGVSKSEPVVESKTETEVKHEDS